MTLKYLGKMSIGAAIPFALIMNGAVRVGVGVGLGELTAKLQGLLNVQAAIVVKPPALLATIDAAIKVTAQLQAAISGPTITLQASAIASLIAALNGQLASLNALLAIQFPTDGTLHLYSYDGRADGFGPELAGATIGGFPGGSASDHCNGLVLGVTEKATWAKIQFCFRT